MKATTQTKPNVAYGQIYDDTRAMIMVMSGMTETALDDAATELNIDYEIFCADYQGPFLVDAYVGFAAMLRQWPSPWPSLDVSSLNGLTVAQFFLAWGWEQNNVAKYCLERLGYISTP